MTTIQAPAGGNSADTPLVVELYQLAMMIYLNRATEPLFNKRAGVQNHIDRAFVLLSQLTSCDRQFPVFILGLEARGDEQRAVILDLTYRAENKDSSRSYNHTRRLLQCFWAQDDLADGEVDYVDKMTYLLGLCKIAPTFL